MSARLLARSGIAALAAVLALAVAAGSAPAAGPCGQAILEDWLDNDRIDRIYDLRCYEAAIDAIPADLVPYTNAEDIIRRAFQRASGRPLEKRELEGSSTKSEPPPQIAPPVNASASTSVPTPLIVLSGLAAVLLASGGLGYVSRRRRDS